MRSITRDDRRRLEAENRKWPLTMRSVARRDWPDSAPDHLAEVWRSRYFLCQVYREQDGMERLSINRTSHTGDSWEDAMTWDELMEVKRQVGRGHRDALEVYPADKDIVNVANFRHLWVPLAPVWFAWRA
jgi:hypothetical protein